MSSFLSHTWKVDDRFCGDPAGILDARFKLGLTRFESFALAERGLKPTFIQVLLTQKDVNDLFKNKRDFTHTLTIVDSRGREFKFKNLGLHFVESACELIYESPDDLMIVTLTDNRRFLGTLPVDKKFNVLHPIFDGKTYYASTLKTDGEEKRPWNWIEVIKNIWEIAYPNKPLAFPYADLDVDPVTLEVNTEPDDDERLLAQPVNLKLRGSFYGVMSWIASYLGHEFLYDGTTDSFSFERFKIGEKPKQGIESWQKFVEDNLGIYLSNAGAGVSPSLNSPAYFNAPKSFVVRYPKANYDYNAGQPDEDSELSYHSLNKYLDKSVDNPYPLRAAETAKKVLNETVVAIYQTNGTQSEEETDRITQHAKKRADLIGSEYALAMQTNRGRFQGVPNGWASPIFNQHLLALSFRHLPEGATICETSSGSNRLDDYSFFYKRYGRDFAEFRKEFHEENFWEPNEEYVGHHRAYVELDETLESGKFVEATLLRFDRIYGEDDDPDTISVGETSTLKIQVGNPYSGRTYAKSKKLWVVLNRQAKSWVPDDDGSPCPSDFSGQIEVIDSTRGVYMDNGDVVIATRLLTVNEGRICECSEPDPDAEQKVCTGERRIPICPADCEGSVGESEICNQCGTNRDDWPDLEGNGYYSEVVQLLKVTITGQASWGIYANPDSLVHTTFVSYHAPGSFGWYFPFIVDGGTFKYPSIYYGARFDYDPETGWSTPEDVGLWLLPGYRVGCIDPAIATEENIGSYYPDLVGVGGYIVKGVYQQVGNGSAAPIEMTIQVPLVTADPVLAEGDYEAPNGTTYHFKIECAGTPTSLGSEGGPCCDPMPEAASIKYSLDVERFGAPLGTTFIEIAGGEDGEYVSSTPLLENPELHLFFKCENGSITVWAEDDSDNVYELTTTTAFDCKFADEEEAETPGVFFSVGGFALEELNLYFNLIAVVIG